MSDASQSTVFDAPLHPQWVLEARAHGRETQRFDLIGDRLVIGRANESDIQLDSVRVSRRHAELSHETVGYWKIRDLGSRNGTKVNESLILENTMVRPSDRIQIGEFELHIQLVSASKQPEATTPDTTLWIQTPQSSFTQLSSAPAPRLVARHLAMVHSLGERLLETPDAGERLQSLCRWMLDSEIRGTMAVALRAKRGDGISEPATLCSIQSSGAPAGLPRVLRSVVDAAARDEQPILAGGTAASGLTVSFPENDRGITAAIACPLRSDATTVDVLYVAIPKEFGTVDWLALVALAAEQYKKAELQIEARRRTKEGSALQNDLKKARQIQMSLVPTKPAAKGLEIAIGFEPCDWIGGDYVNVMEAPDGNVLLAIADVSGKGLPAALVAGGVHSIVHASIRSGRSLTDLAQSLNQYLLESLELQSFVTMLAVLFEPATGKIQMINAGHPPLLIVDESGKVTEARYGHNPPLGVMPMTVEIDVQVLEKNQLMMFYTDGLSELMDTKRKMLGLPGLEKEIGAIYSKAHSQPLTDLQNTLKQRLDEIHGTAPATDDRTVMLARRT